jgi:hypothetical protein
MMLRLSAIATVVLSGLAYGLVDEVAAAGVLLGGIAGLAGFRLLSGRLRRLATIAPEKLHATMLAGAYMRLLVYAMFLIAGYMLDRRTLHGFFGAFAGLMTVRLVPIYGSLAATRLRTRARGAGNREKPD